MYFCYTDGGCRVSDRNPGGWGVYIRTPKGETIEKFGGALDTNPTMMELMAIKEALNILPQGIPVTIFSDSQEVLNFCEKSIPVWQSNEWKNTPRIFDSILREISKILEEKKLKITWTWIKSHNGNVGNERADQLADQGARDAKKLIKHFGKIK
jgi:ribonuclease HI